MKKISHLAVLQKRLRPHFLSRVQPGRTLLGPFFILSLFVGLGLNCGGFISNVRADSVSPTSHPKWSTIDLAHVPIQAGGRVKPLDSFARESVLYLTGSRTFMGFGALDLLMSWVALPESWQDIPMIQVGRADVRRQLGLNENRQLFSPSELMGNSILIQYAKEAMSPQKVSSNLAGDPNEASSRKEPRELELKSVLDRIGLFHNLITGQNLAFIATPTPNAWINLVDTQITPENENEPQGEPEGMIIRGQFARLIKAYQAGDQTVFERAAREFRAAVEGEMLAIPEFSENMLFKIRAEVLTNRVRFFLWAWVAYAVAGSLWMVSEARKPKAPKKSGKAAFSKLKMGALLTTFFAFTCHTLGMVLRSYIADRPPVTNMYESVVWVSFGVLVFAFILYVVKRQAIVLAVASFLAVLGLVAADVSPTILDPAIRPLVPVLRSNYWLTIHVLTITLGYAAFALSLGLANVSLYHHLKRDSKAQVLSLNLLTYRAVQFGVVLIAAGTILGGIWADYSWGRFWGWDPKEVWALITLLTYIVVLHGRYTNWMGSFGFAVWSALSFLSVLMAWYGVNFILGAGLHSYGFASGGTPWVGGFVLLQVAYIGLIALKRRKLTS